MHAYIYIYMNIYIYIYIFPVLKFADPFFLSIDLKALVKSAQRRLLVKLSDLTDTFVFFGLNVIVGRKSVEGNA